MTLRVAVVGHTNTGKTSLLRTLTRDTEFGEVSDRPAVTRDVAGMSLAIDGRPVLELYDTPGLEDSIGLRDLLNDLRADRRDEGIRVVEQFLDGDEARGLFSQEAKALRQVLACDVVLYVIDARDRVLGKHRDELEILGWCARPVVPVLNFVAGEEARTAQWREHLSRANMHAVAEFDTVVFDNQDEQRLYEKMQTLLDAHRVTLDAWMRHRVDQRRMLLHASARLLAEMLIDTASLVVVASPEKEADAQAAITSIKQAVRERESQCIHNLLRLHRFPIETCEAEGLPLVDGRWGLDLFSPEALQQFGLRASGAAATGAMVGLTLDVMLGGLSLGTGTAIGAALGALYGAGRQHGRRLIDRVRGRSEVRCNDATIRLLEARQLALINALLRRGHASIDRVQLVSGSEPAGKLRPLDGVLREARTHPRWCRIARGSSTRDSHDAATPDASREAAVADLTNAITRKLDRPEDKASRGEFVRHIQPRPL